MGTSALSNEEKDKTAEFLLSHPLSRSKVVLEKLLSILVEIIILNLIVISFSLLGILFIDISVNRYLLWMLFLSYFIMEIEIAGITLGISAFIKNSGVGLGLGFATSLYFLHIISNLTDKGKFLKYLTPFGYTEGSYIIDHGHLNVEYLIPGICFCLIGIGLAFLKYSRKDIR